jgi:hypothetical protein
VTVATGQCVQDNGAVSVLLGRVDTKRNPGLSCEACETVEDVPSNRLVSEKDSQLAEGREIGPELICHHKEFIVPMNPN